MNKSCSKNIFLRFSFFVLLHLLVAAYRGVYKTWRVIYIEVFFAKILNGFKLLTIFAKKLYHKCSIGLNIGFWLTVSNIRLTFVPSLQIKSRSYCVTSFMERQKGVVGSKQSEYLCRRSHLQSFLKRYYEKFRKT